MKTKEEKLKKSIEILLFLSKRKEAFLKADYITEKFEIKPPELRKTIHYLRTCGVPIISTSNGYCYTTDQDMIIKSIISLNNRGKSIMEAASGLMQSLHDTL